MKAFILATSLVAVLHVGSAFACEGPQPPNCSCDKTTNTWVMNTVNGINGNVSSSSSSNSSSTSKAKATGGSVLNSGNSSASIAKGAVTNTVSGGQGGSATISNSGNASIAAGAVQNTVAGGSATIASGAVQASASANGAGAGSGDNSNNTEIVSNYRAAKIPVSTAYSAGLTSGLDTCLGSVSAGAQTGILGLTFGSTKVDKNCVIIKRTHLITEFSVPAGCDYMLKNVPGAAEAFKDVGAVCVPPPVPVTPPVVTTTPTPTPTAPAPVVVEVPVKKIGQ